MEASIELIFLLVFFVPMGILVTLSMLFYSDPPDIVAPWARIAAPGVREPAPAPVVEPRIAAPRTVEADNEEEALEAA